MIWRDAFTVRSIEATDQTRRLTTRKRNTSRLSAPVVVSPKVLAAEDQRTLRKRLAGRTRVEASRRAPHSRLRPPPSPLIVPSVELSRRKVRVTLGGAARLYERVRAPHSRLRGPAYVQGSQLPVSSPVAAGSVGLGGSGLATPTGVLIRAPQWRFVLQTTSSKTLTFLDRIASKRTVVYTLNQSTISTGEADSDNTEINTLHTDGDPFLAEGNRFLLGFRRYGSNPKWVIVYSGIVLQINDYVTGDAPKSAYTAYDPWEYLKHRPCRLANGDLPGDAGLTFVAQRGDEIAHALIRRTIEADGSVYTDIGGEGGTAYYGGTMQPTPQIDMTFAQGSTVGDALTQLTETGTLDIYFSPIYDPFNRPGFISELNVYNEQGSRQYASVMSWDATGNNLAAMNRLEDGTQRANIVQNFRTNSIPVGQVADTPSIAKFGEWWDLQTFEASYPASVVEALAAETLLIRKGRPQTIQVTPSPEISPVPFVEYFIGDTVPISASKRLREPLNGFGRIYSIPIDIDDESVEKVTGLEFSADSLTLTTGSSGDVPPPPSGFTAEITGGDETGDVLGVSIFPA